MFSRLNSQWVVVAVSVILIAGLGALLLWKDKPNEPEPIILQCAAALREPIQEIIPLYAQQTGQRIEVRYGESQKIINDMQLTKQGDLFLPADDSYIQDALKQNLIGDVFPLASMSAIVAVKADNPQPVATWNDLFKPELHFAIANPEAAAISRLARTHLGEPRWKALEKRAIAMGPVTQVANAVQIDRNIDAGLIWDSMLASPNYQGLRGVKLKELEGITASVKIGVSKNSARADAAKNFANFLAASCSDIFQKHGFTPVNAAPPIKEPPPKKATETPEIVLYAGAMLRPAIEETIKEFEKREGVRVIRVYNGCGILVSQMKAGERPDAYFSCDPTFMNQVEDLFEKSKVVSKNQLVIAVKKGNPHGITSLKDLGKEGLKIGVGHEQQCALGVITQGVLIRSKTLKAVEANVAVRSPSGDLLVNQLRTGSLDAAVVYISNVKPYEGDLDAIKVEEVNCAPTQPFAVSRTTAHPEVVKRLLTAIESVPSKERFEKLGFGWELQP